MTIERCPKCGQKMDDWKLDEHVGECDGEPPTPWTGTCPMCGERYREYFDHIKHCEGTLDGEKTAAGVGGEDGSGWGWGK